MPPKQRQIKVEQRSALAAMQQLETRSDEELAAEQKHKAAAQAILGARAAERYDAATARKHFQRAIAAARPQERMALRRMADASLALAERRPDDLKQAVERLGQAPPSQPPALPAARSWACSPRRRAPAAGARVRGIALVVGLVVALLAIGFGLAKLVALPFGGVATLGALLLGLRDRRRRPRRARAARAGAGRRKALAASARRSAPAPSALRTPTRGSSTFSMTTGSVGRLVGRVGRDARRCGRRRRRPCVTLPSSA